MTDRKDRMPLGVVIRRSPGVTRWAPWAWKAVAVIPGAGPGNWTELRREGEVIEYHAATATLELFRTDTEAYVEALAARVPSVFVVMRQGPQGRPEVTLVTASPYEAQDYADSGELLVEPVGMPPALHARIAAFVEAHHSREPFVKRQRDRTRVDRVEDGRGDPRIAQTTDVYRAPRRKAGP